MNIKKIILIICIGVFAFSSYKLYDIYHTYDEIKEESNEIVEEYVVDTVEDNTNVRKSYRFDKLLQRNKDVVGWVYIPNTRIDEPILKGENNDTYIRTNIDGKHSISGCIFMEEINNADFSDANTILYGHHLKNGYRFSDLKKWNNEAFFNENQSVYISTLDNTEKEYEIFSFCILNKDSDLYSLVVNDKDIKEASKYYRKHKEYEHTIMLSTCRSGGSDERYVIFAGC